MRTIDAPTRGLLIASAGFLLVPGVLLVVAVVPDGARVATFLAGLGLVIWVAGRGGWIARAAFVAGGPRRVRAFVGATLGLVVAATAGMILVWSLFGLAIG